ncbi:MAG: preprotein translocase subunit SecE [Thermogutta sp.]|nr:preprotein translocase subunit SecE [Thermogutta sp.]
MAAIVMAQAASAKFNSVFGRFLTGLVRADLYKRNQGRVVRQATFGAIVAFGLFGAWRLYGTLGSWGFEASWQFGVPAAVFAIAVWLAYRLMNFPEVADFLIAVEAEMRKVTWPTRAELIRSCVVVLVTMFSLAFCLTIYDFIWASFLRWTGIL